MYGFIMACIELYVTGETLYHTEKQGFVYPWLSVLATNLLPLTGLLSKLLASMKWVGPRMPKVNFLEYLGQGTLGCHSLSHLLFGHFSSPINVHTHSS